MRLYLSPDGVWTGTQADAKAHAKANATTWEEVEVPVDKAGLMSFLNKHRVGAAVPPVLSAPSLPDDVVKELEQSTTIIPQPITPLPLSLQTLPIEEAIWEMPLHEAVRLGTVVFERIREFARKA